jgi:hypothetical protein
VASQEANDLRLGVGGMARHETMGEPSEGSSESASSLTAVEAWEQANEACLRFSEDSVLGAEAVWHPFQRQGVHTWLGYQPVPTGSWRNPLGACTCRGSRRSYK